MDNPRAPADGLRPPLHGDRVRAELYDRARPSYPSALADELLRTGARRVLDVGCGTGIASRVFVARGCDVVGVEPDARMAAVARRSGLQVEPGAFEHWDPAGRRFELLVAGQAWHWVDPVRGGAKAATVLEPGGRAGLFWNRGRHRPEAKEELDAIYRRLAPSLDGYAIVLGNHPDRRFDLAADGLRQAGFADVTITTFEWHDTYTSLQWVDHLQTHSDHRTLEPATLARLLTAVEAAIDGWGGVLHMAYDTWLVSGFR